MDNEDRLGLMLGSFALYKAGQAQRRAERKAEYDWNVEESRRENERRNEEWQRQQQEQFDQYVASGQYARDQEIKRIEDEKQKQRRQLRRQERARQAKQIINNPSLPAHHVYFINQLVAMGFPQPTYYATNTFAFFFAAERNEEYGNMPVVWTWLDDNENFQVEVKQYYHPQMKEINQAVAGLCRGQTQHEPPTNAAWLMSSLKDVYRRAVSPAQKSAHDVTLIERLMAIGLAEPTYYAPNCFAFWYGKLPIVWTYLDQNNTYQISWRDYFQPQMEEINKAVTEWRMANGDKNENQ